MVGKCRRRALNEMPNLRNQRKLRKLERERKEEAGLYEMVDYKKEAEAMRCWIWKRSSLLALLQERERKKKVVKYIRNPYGLTQ